MAKTKSKNAAAKKKTVPAKTKRKPMTRRELLRSVELLPPKVPAQTIDKMVKQAVPDSEGQMGPGRPAKYDPRYCKKYVELMANGYTKTAAAGRMGLRVETVIDWSNPSSPRYKPEFSQAVKAGAVLSEMWWDEVGHLNLHNKEFNNTLYMMFRQNLHGWTRRLEGRIETSHEEIHTHKQVVEVKMADEQYAEILRILVECGAIEQSAERPADTQTH
jgi:hypothetical protein